MPGTFSMATLDGSDERRNTTDQTNGTLYVPGLSNGTFPHLCDDTHAYYYTDCDYDWDYYYRVVLPKKMAAFVFPKTHEWILIAAYVAVFILAVVGNLLVCFAVFKNRQMRTVTNFYIVNLAVADILVSLICLPVTVVLDTTETWFFGPMACKLIPYLQVVSMSVSVFTLGAIAVDRYFAICKPLTFRMTAKRAFTGILAIWFASFLIPIPLSIVYESESPMASLVYLTSCYEKKWHQSVLQKVYHILLVLVIYILPLALISVSYACVCRQLWATIPGSSESDTEKNAMNKHGGLHKSAQSQLQTRRKAAKMLISVAVIFTVCYLPLHVLNVLRHFEVFIDMGHDNRHLFHVPYLVAHWLAFANSATNPIIYNFLSAKFRREFVAAFICCRFCRDYSRRELIKRRRTVYRGSVLSSSSINSMTKTNGNHTKHITMSSLRNSSIPN